VRLLDACWCMGGFAYVFAAVSRYLRSCDGLSAHCVGIADNRILEIVTGEVLLCSWPLGTGLPRDVVGQPNESFEVVAKTELTARYLTRGHGCKHLDTCNGKKITVIFIFVTFLKRR